MDSINKLILTASLACLLLVLASAATGAAYGTAMVIFTLILIDRVIERDKWFALRLMVSLCAFYGIVFCGQMLKILIGWVLS